MKMKPVRCPGCDAAITMDLTGRKTVFCPYCGLQIAIDTGEKVVTRNVNKTINKNVNVRKRYTNDAAIAKEKRKTHENWGETLFLVVSLLVVLGLLYMCYQVVLGFRASSEARRNEEREKIESGMIQPGQPSEDLIGKDAAVVKEQLESAGFANITMMEIKDTTWFNKNKGKVESVTIGGKASFWARDYFNPDAEIIITYYK